MNHPAGGITKCPSNLIRLSLSLALACCACGHESAKSNGNDLAGAAAPQPAVVPSSRPAGVKLILVVVALCDNANQGIVPVPARLGNGDDPDSNLYWGAAFGVRTYFSKASGWRKLAQIDNPRSAILQRCVFRYGDSNTYIVADAYRGLEIRRGISDFLEYASGASLESGNLPALQTGGTLGGPPDLAVFVGHNGLMDFSLTRYPQSRDGSRRDAMVLCCASRQYFSDAIRASGAQPLLLTTNLMAPEAYVLEAAIKGWISGETGKQICSRAAIAYNNYQKCGYRAAQALFSTGY